MITKIVGGIDDTVSYIIYMRDQIITAAIFGYKSSKFGIFDCNFFCPDPYRKDFLELFRG